MSLTWEGPAAISRGVSERPFAVAGAGRRIPGIVWSPEDATEPRPLVLLGHGASLHKRADYILSMARRFVRHHGYVALSIDGPNHGARRADGGLEQEKVFAEFAELWREPTIVDDTIADWRAVLDAAALLPEVDATRVGYWGVSMGTIFGLPLVCADRRVRAAALGLMGTVGPTAERLRADARALAVPVLFVQQWHDELIERQGTLDLFDAISSPDKALHVNPGLHGAMPESEYDATEAFLARYLGA